MNDLSHTEAASVVDAHGTKHSAQAVLMAAQVAKLEEMKLPGLSEVLIRSSEVATGVPHLE